ncbi:hypothetical protein CRM22_005522 [Opisthorchis felineus]|uniref:Uncharacterized protein n=1 Tax=Opisthorchis felineus TaxID=147828 RepID=A0A4S2LQM4_OPIFE|nr:hypothetical protein CRM22_005522 [Opisthorchis felineus]
MATGVESQSLKSHFPKMIYKPQPSEKLLKKPSELRWNCSRINQLEDHLLKHPLILFPYLQKYLPTKIFEDAFTLLEPGVKPFPLDTCEKLPKKGLKTTKQRKSQNSRLIQTLREKRITTKEVEPNIFIQNPSIRLKTEEFCRWIFELDQEETGSPQPKAIAELFISPYESRATGHATMLMREINRPIAALRDLVRKTDGAPKADRVFTLRNAPSQKYGDISPEQHIKTPDVPHGSQVIPKFKQKAKFNSPRFSRPRGRSTVQQRTDIVKTNVLRQQ